jgi:uncharacterized membrane protein
MKFNEKCTDLCVTKHYNCVSIDFVLALIYCNYTICYNFIFDISKKYCTIN